MRDNDLLNTISFPNLETLGQISSSSIDIRANTLESIDLNKLAVVADFRLFSTTTLTTANLSSIQDFDSISLSRLASTEIDGLITRLVNITPLLTGKRISLRGTASSQAITDIETLRTNGNTISIRD